MEEQRFLFSSCTMVDNQLFFIEHYTGLPTLMNLESGDISYCGMIHDYIHKVGDIVDHIDCCRQKVYILETSGENLVILDLEKSECFYKKLDCDYYPWGNYAAFEKYQSDYYIFPRYGDKIFVVNTNNDKIMELTADLCEIGEPRFCCRAGNKIWILSDGKKVIGAFDLVCQTIEIYELKEKVENPVDAVAIGENIYFLNQFGIIYKWDINKKQIEVFKTLKIKQDKKVSVSKMIHAGNSLIVFPAMDEDINIVDLSTKEIKIYQGYPSGFEYQAAEWGWTYGWAQYFGYCEDASYYYFAMRSANYVLKVNKEDGEFSWIKPKLPMLEETQKLQNQFLREKTRIELLSGKKFFLDKELKITELITIDVGNIGNTGNEKGSLVGPKIYEEIKNK